MYQLPNTEPVGEPPDFDQEDVESQFDMAVHQIHYEGREYEWKYHGGDTFSSYVTRGPGPRWIDEDDDIPF